MRGYSLRRLLWAGPVATVIGIGANFVYFRVTQAMGEPYLIPLDANGSRFVNLPAALPMLGAAFGGLLATVFFAILLHTVRKPVIVFISVAITALILSFGGSLGMPVTGGQTKLYLSGMNMLTAMIVVGGILLLGREKAGHK